MSSLENVIIYFNKTSNIGIYILYGVEEIALTKFRFNLSFGF
jgi:hypothetical protein